VVREQNGSIWSEHRDMGGERVQDRFTTLRRRQTLRTGHGASRTMG
jgi:hypothetical protein